MTKEEKVVLSTARVIELKPGKKYLLVFAPGSFRPEDVEAVMQMLEERGINTIGAIFVDEPDKNLKVIES